MARTSTGSGAAASWSDILIAAARQAKRHDIADRAAALTYRGVLALFPALLVLISILGLLGQSTVDHFLDNVDDLAPAKVSSVLRDVVEQVEGRSGSAGIAIGAGLIVALWTASGYVAGFMRAANAIHDVDEGRPIWRTAPVRMFVTFTLIIMMAASAIIIVITGPIARAVGRGLGIGSSAVTLWDILKWPALLVVVSLMFSLLYWACPDVKQPRFEWISPGGVLAVILWLIVSGGFAVYVSFFNSYNRTYGTMATAIIFLVWLWISNIAVLFGAEFNAEFHQRRRIENGSPHATETGSNPISSQTERPRPRPK